MTERVLMTLGMKCPKPLFDVHKMMKDIRGADVLRIMSDDPAFRLDIQAWCRRTGNELVELNQESDRLVAVIRKV